MGEASWGGREGGGGAVGEDLMRHSTFQLGISIDPDDNVGRGIGHLVEELSDSPITVPQAEVRQHECRLRPLANDLLEV